THRDGAHEQAPSERAAWYECACCPPNLARLLASLQGYVATTADGRLRLHLLADAVLRLGERTLTVRTDQPWGGRMTLTFDAPHHGAVEVRVPAWATGVRLIVDDPELPVERSPPAYVLIAGHDVRLTHTQRLFSIP